jgi:hypothetical protein
MRVQWNEITFPKLTVRHQYDADYALEVHEGASFQGGFQGSIMSDNVNPNPDLRARPWVETTLYEADFAQLLADKIKSADVGSGGIGVMLHEAFYVANDELGEMMQMNLLDPRWFWPGETIRVNGETVGSPRDIYDTGNLYRSYRMFATA